MFVQVIQGKIADAEGMRRQAERWQEELRPGATGYLGSTAGIADDGTFVAFVRFASAEEAQRNSERPEQGAWWADTAKCIDGEASFLQGDDVDTMLEGGSNQAGFVQIMHGTVTDREALTAMEQELLPQLQSLRPDLIGSVRLWSGSQFTDAIYFTSESEARKGEEAMGQDTGGEFERWADLIKDVSFIDLRDPWLH